MNKIQSKLSVIDATGQNGEQPTLQVGVGKLADAAAQIRAQLARDLKNGKPIEVSASGNATGQNGEQPTLQVGEGKLADAAAQIRVQLAFVRQCYSESPFSSSFSPHQDS